MTSEATTIEKIGKQARRIAAFPSWHQFAFTVSRHNQIDPLISNIESKCECNILTNINHRNRGWRFVFKLGGVLKAVRSKDVGDFPDIMPKFVTRDCFVTHRAFFV
jgi:hypothetical protein